MEKQETVQGSYSSPLPAEKLLSLDSKNSGGDNFMVDDLFDFSNDDLVVATDAAIDSVTGNSTDSSTVTVVDSCNSSTFSGYDPNFSGDIACRNVADSNISGDLCVPCDDLAELEWLSNFVEESFSCDDLQKLQLISGVKGRHDESSETHQFQSELNQNNSSSNNDNNNNENAANNSPVFQPEIPVPAKARSKRSRAAPCNWASRLLVLSPTSSSSSETEIVATGPPPPPVPQTTGKKTVKACTSKKRDGGGDGSDGNGEGRRCLHCATDKTPQWRTGPMGPKTLCNACGVRFKSGRLVPEYRPASSPTFVLTKHSNSHRKVLELRRQKEMVRMQQQQQHQFIHHHHHQNMMFDVSNGEDFLIHQHVGPDFRQLI